MNGYERYMSMVTKGRADVLPRVPIVMQFAAEYIGSNYGAFASDHRVLVEANRRCAEDFGFDQLSAISDPYRETQGFGAEIVYERDSVPKCPHPPLEGGRDLSKLPRPDPLSATRMKDRVDAISLYKRECYGEYSIMGWVEGPAAEAADLRGVGNFLVDLMDDERFSCELMDRCLETAIDFARAQVGAGADTIGVGDAIASQVSPAVYGRLIQPREKRLVEAIHDMGALVRLHICGDITRILTGIADLGVDILDVDHMVDMSAARRAVGTKVTLAGNIDPVEGVLRGTPASIQRQVAETFRTVGAPFMVNAGCEIPAGTPRRNLLSLCRKIRCPRL